MTGQGDFPCKENLQSADLAGQRSFGSRHPLDATRRLMRSKQAERQFGCTSRLTGNYRAERALCHTSQRVQTPNNTEQTDNMEMEAINDRHFTLE